MSTQPTPEQVAAAGQRTESIRAVCSIFSQEDAQAIRVVLDALTKAQAELTEANAAIRTLVTALRWTLSQQEMVEHENRSGLADAETALALPARQVGAQGGAVSLDDALTRLSDCPACTRCEDVDTVTEAVCELRYALEQWQDAYNPLDGEEQIPIHLWDAWRNAHDLLKRL